MSLKSRQKARHKAGSKLVAINCGMCHICRPDYDDSSSDTCKNPSPNTTTTNTNIDWMGRPIPGDPSSILNHSDYDLSPHNTSYASTEELCRVHFIKMPRQRSVKYRRSLGSMPGMPINTHQNSAIDFK